jgi:hypothetical protein
VTDKNLTEIVAILDRSGSMGALRAETIGGFNNFVEEQKKAEGIARITLVQFDDKYQIDYEGKDVKEVPALDESTYVPRGMTALYDAVGKTMITLGERLAKLDEDKRPGQVVVLIITDGLENSSKEYAGDKLREMITHQEEKYNWTFVFLGGGDIKKQKLQGANLGINAANVYGFAATKGGTDRLYRNVSKGITRRREAAATGEAVLCCDSVLSNSEARELETGEDEPVNLSSTGK